MRKINSYQELLEEEKRTSEKLEQSLNALTQIGTELFDFKNILSSIWENNKKEIAENQSNEDANLTSLLLDLAYQSLTQTLLKNFFTSENPRTNKIKMSVKLTVKSFLDNYFEKNRKKISNVISEFVDQKLSDWKK